jgi:hypothetical protein
MLGVEDDPFGTAPIEDRQEAALLTAYCGVDNLSRILEEYETKLADHHAANWVPETNRCYGAYAVTNLNDTDGDTVKDKDDSSVKKHSNGANRDEIDLFKIMVWIPDYFDGSDHGGTDGIGLKAKPNSGIKFWKNRTKVESWDGFDDPQPGTVHYIWVEVTKKSTVIGDQWIEVKHAFTEDATGKKILEYDLIDVTGIWAEMENDRTQMVPFKVKEGNPDVPVFVADGDFSGGIVPAGFPQVGEIISIFDDQNDDVTNAAGAIVDRYDQAPEIAGSSVSLYRVSAVNGGSITVASIGGGPSPVPPWFAPGDWFATTASAKLDREATINRIWQHDWRIGDKRYTPAPRHAWELAMKVTPPGITWKKLGDNRKAMFDITRQMRHAVSANLLDGKISRNVPWPKLGGTLLDETPNDDPDSVPQDCETTNHDILFSYDAPGPLIHVGMIDHYYVARTNFYEFVRVDFVPLSTKNEGGPDPDGSGPQPAPHWGENKRVGSRCSDKIKWCTAKNFVADPDKKLGTGYFYRHRPLVGFDGILATTSGGPIADGEMHINVHLSEESINTVDNWDPDE